MKNNKAIKLISLTSALVSFAWSIGLLFNYLNERANGNNDQMLFTDQLSWFSAWHIDFYTGVDGISISMILLTSVVVLAGVLISWNIARMSKEFYILLLLLSIGAYGFFISLDLFSMFFFLELAVIPKFLLIAIWGSGKKIYSANKLALMLMGGSALVLVSFLGVYYVSGNYFSSPTFDLLKISSIDFPIETQRLLFCLSFLGFGVFTALFPFHTWAPDGHSSAPTAASMFLAGISMKLGGYGCIRVATYLFPQAAVEMSPYIIILASIAILYGAFATLMQKDLKYMNAYSSVSHCGFVLLGIGMLTKTSITGAIMQMVSHGLMTALFFAAIGMLYERTHSRMLDQLSGLLKAWPFISTLFIIAGLCSLGLPGFSGFVSEMTIFVGSFENEDLFRRIATIAACMSIVVTAVYILRAIGKVIMSSLEKESYLQIQDAGWNEKTASVILIIAILIIGLMPWALIHLINPDSEIIINKILGMSFYR
jgi:NADH-quinone oxidoreductase subunit M